MLHEEKITKIDTFEPIKCLRLNLMRFMKNLTFNETFVDSVITFMENQKQFNLFNLLKEIAMKKRNHYKNV